MTWALPSFRNTKEAGGGGGVGRKWECAHSPEGLSGGGRLLAGVAVEGDSWLEWREGVNQGGLGRMCLNDFIYPPETLENSKSSERE
jgi:hypothetical protein